VKPPSTIGAFSANDTDHERHLLSGTGTVALDRLGEAFGLVIVEAIACEKPVIAFHRARCRS
jgi:glycosyltransferase involved in cell wall biosynthesis